MNALRNMLIRYFNEGELRTLCRDLGVDYDDLSGSGKADKARELVDFLDRRVRISELIAAIKHERPNIPDSEFLALQAVSNQENTTKSHLNAIAYRLTPGVDLYSRDAQYNIMYVGRVIGKQRKDVEGYFGKLDEINVVNVGSSDSIPEGGEVRWYHYEDYLLSVAYNIDDAVQGIRFEDFDKHNYTFSDYFEVFHRLGISVATLPDISSPIMWGWRDYQGYYLSIALNKVEGVVNIVRIYRISK